jgi:hypothetical protein
MKDRRTFLSAVGTGVASSVAGCIGLDPIRRAGREPPRTPRGGTDDVETPGDPAATPPSNADKVDIELPGEPRRIRNGRLPTYRIREAVNSGASRFETGLGSGSKRLRSGGGKTGLTFAPEHRGTGRAGGYATGTYRTAWTAPETGQYQLKATFNRWGEFRYNLPRTGEVMMSFDINAQIVNYDTSTVVANRRFPQSLRSSNQRASSEMGEFLIETALTALVGYSLGLGLVARVVLHRIVDELIELESPGGTGRGYDVVTGVERAPTPLNIGGPFEVTAGTTAVFEISPMLSWSYRVEDVHMNPRFDANFDLDGFWVKKLD